MAQPPVLPEDIWRDLNVPGNPLSGARLPPKGDIIALIRWLIDYVNDLGDASGLDPTVIPNINAAINALDGRLDAAEPALANLTQSLVPGGGAVLPDGRRLMLAALDALSRVGFGLFPDGRIYSAVHEALFSDKIAWAYAGGSVLFAIADMQGRALLILRTTGEIEFYGQMITPEAAAFASEIVHGIITGQSNAGGDEAFPTLSPPSTTGALMFARGMRTWIAGDNATTPAARPGGDFALVTLANGGGGEAVLGLAEHLKTSLYGRNRVGPISGIGPTFLFSICRRGESFLHEIDKATGTYGIHQTIIDDVTRAKAAATAQGKRYKVGFVLFEQGENEAQMQIQRGGPSLPWLQFRDAYIAKMMQWGRDLDTDIRAITGQSDPVRLFTFQAVYAAPGTAQMLAARKSPQITMVGPVYYLPSAKNSLGSGNERGAGVHWSADGHRWYDALCAKVIRRTAAGGSEWRPCEPLRARWSKGFGSITLTCHVPVPPLVVDTSLLPAQTTGAGFRVVFSDGSSQVPTRVTVVGPNELRIDIPGQPPAGTTAELEYGTNSLAFIATATVAAYRNGTGTIGGQSVKEIVLASIADLARFGPLISEGAFKANETTIRGVYQEGQTLVLRAQANEIFDAALFPVGGQVYINRFYSYGNIRDSDDEVSVQRFAGDFGTRQGRQYPLHNWLCSFIHLPIES